MSVNKSEQIWQFLSINGRERLLNNSEISDLYTDNEIDNQKVKEIAIIYYKDLDKQYQDFLDIVTPYEYPYLSKQEGWSSFHGKN